MTDNPTNFADVLADTLSPALRDELLQLGEQADMAAVWNIILRNHVVLLDPVNFVRKSDKELIGEKSFTFQYTPVVNGIAGLPGRYIGKPVAYAIATDTLERASKGVYEPGLPDWPTRTRFNMYRPPGFDLIEERPDAFLKHMRYLIPDPREYALTLAYLKWMVQRPQDKMTFALLIVGRKGTGKSWLASFFQALFGAHNVLVIERGARVADRFNDDERNKRLVFVDELVPDGKMDLAKAIIPKIIAPSVTIEGKGVNKFTVPNRYNIVAVTNYPNAIKIEGAKDRKWLVVRSTPSIWGEDAKGKPTLETKEYYDQLFAMTKVGDSPADVSDEIKRALWWLSTSAIKSKEFNGQGIAPQTLAKAEVAEITETTHESTINGAFADAEGPFRFELFAAEDVRLAYTLDDGRKPKEIEAEITMLLDELNCRRVGPQQVYLPPRKRPRRLWCRSVALLPKYEKMTAAELAKAYKAERTGKAPDPVAAGLADFEDDPPDNVDNEGARAREAV